MLPDSVELLIMEYHVPDHIVFLERRIRYLQKAVLERGNDFDFSLGGRAIEYHIVPRHRAIFSVLPYPKFVVPLTLLPHESPVIIRELRYLQDGTRVPDDPEKAAFVVYDWCERRRKEEVKFLRDEWFCCSFEAQMADCVETFALRFETDIIDAVAQLP